VRNALPFIKIILKGESKMSIRKIKCNMLDSTNEPKEWVSYPEVTILPSDNVQIIGQRIKDGKVIQVFAKDDELENNEFYVFGSTMFGCGVSGYGYGYGFNDQEELDYFSEIEKYRS
jgi:hypothetical protein